MEKLYELTASHAVAMMHQSKLKPSDLLRSCLERIHELESDVHAFQHLDTKAAIEQAERLDKLPPDGLLYGIPFGVKDLIDTADMPTTYGSPIYTDHRPAWDAPCVAQLKQQGAILVGKTVTTEFAMYHPGKTANPHNVAHTPGGSSSGSAAAVAAGMLPLAFGTQTAASVFRPASFCGVVGYKPSLGLIHTGGVKPLAQAYDTIGLMGRCVEDVALMAAASSRRADLIVSEDVLTSSAPKVGIFKTPHWDIADQCTKDAVLGFAEKLRCSGISVTEVESYPGFSGLGQAQSDIMESQAFISYSYEYEHNRSLMSDILIDLLQRGCAVSQERLLQAEQTVLDARRFIKDVFHKVDILVTPAVRGEAPEGLDATGDPVFGRLWTALLTPGLTLPYSEGPKGLPVGVLLVGPNGKDARFLRQARFLERAISL